MIAAKCSSFSSKLWNHRPKQLAALCLLGQSFSEETHDSSADGSLNQQAAPPTAKKTSNRSACCPSKDVNPVLAWTSLYFQKLLAVSFRLNAWLGGRKENDLWSTLLTMVEICVAETTVILKDNIHKAPQDGCDYFWDGFCVLLRNAVCPSQAAASMLMMLPSNRHGGIQQGSFPDLLHFLGKEKWGRSMRLILHPPPA